MLSATTSPADEVFLLNLQRAEPHEVEEAEWDAALNGCISALEADGVDLTDYESIASAHDLEDIRVALGYAQWDLIGISYGGRLSLSYMREHPDAVRSAILDSVYDVSYGGFAETSASIQRAFDALYEACANSEPCVARGDLESLLVQVADATNAAPLEITVELDGEAIDFVLTGDDLVGGLFQGIRNAPL